MPAEARRLRDLLVGAVSPAEGSGGAGSDGSREAARALPRVVIDEVVLGSPPAVRAAASRGCLLLERWAQVGLCHGFLS